MNPLIELKKTPPLLITLALLCFGLLPRAQGVVPPPDGGYPGFNTAEGQNALQSLTTGSANTAVGWYSLFSNTDGSFNSALGTGTLLFNTGAQNTATGAGALLSNTTGANNTANGESALLFNTTGTFNTANGVGALENNITGGSNTATGVQALQNNTRASFNTAIGTAALGNNTTGSFNTANGVGALENNITGGSNTATGVQALQNNTGASNNTAHGVNALRQNTTASNNTAIGFATLVNNTTGDDNRALGSEAGRDQTTGSGNVYIGRSVVGIAGESDRTYIRNINITGLDGAAVTVDVNTGLLGHATSSRRYKEEIKPMDKASEALYQLKPVTFHYKKEINRTQTLSFGLIAEEVAEVNSDLIVWDSAGKPETVRYEGVNAMLLNEFLKEHRKNEEQQATIAQLKKDFRVTVARLTTRLDEQAAQIQKVSAQLAAASPSRGGLEASKFATGRIRRGGPAPQVVNNP